MSQITRIRQPDGRFADYDEAAVAHEIYQAMREAGQADLALARDLAEVVTFFLARHHPDEIPTIENLLDMVEKVLMETAPGEIAKAYIVRRQRRSTVLAQGQELPAGASRALGQKALFPEAELTVEVERLQQAEYWDRHRIAAALVRELELEAHVAQAVAVNVEARVFDSGLDRVSTGLIRELIDVELFDLGLTDHRQRHAIVGLPKSDLDAACMHAKAGADGTPFLAPADLDAYVSRQVLTRYTLAEVLEPEVAEAHLAGELVVSGLDTPLTLQRLAVAPEGLKHGFPGDPDSAPETFAAFARLLRRYADALASCVSGEIVWPGLLLSLAPLARGELSDPTRRRAALADLFALLAASPAAPRLVIPIELDVPAWLAATPAIGAGGATLPDNLGAYAPEVRALALDALRVLADHGALARQAPRLAVVVDDAALSHESGQRALELAADCAANWGAPEFHFPRGPMPLLGAARVRGAGGFVDGPSGLLGWRAATLGNVTLNLPRAAFTAGRGDLDAFCAALDRQLGLARRALAAREEFLAAAWSRLGTPLLSVGGSRTDAPAHPAAIALDAACGTVSIVGLTEALAYLEPEESAAGDRRLRTGLRALAYLAFQVREASQTAGISSLELRLSGRASADAAARLLAIDRRHRPAAVGSLTEALARGAYSVGFAPPPLPGLSFKEALTRAARYHALAAPAPLFGAACVWWQAQDGQPHPGRVLEAVRHLRLNGDAHALAVPAPAARCRSCGCVWVRPLPDAACSACGRRGLVPGVALGPRFVPGAPDRRPAPEPEPAAPRIEVDVN